MSAAPEPATPPRWPRLTVIAGVVATVVGFIVHGIWRELPVERLLLSLVLALIVWALAWLPHRWLRWSLPSSITVLWSIGLVIYVGPLPVFAACVLAAAALAIGLKLIPHGLSARAAIGTIVGLAVIAGITGWTVTLPIHHDWAWWIAALALILWQRRALFDTVRDAQIGWRNAISEHPRTASACVMLLGLASVACWLPTMQADDLSFHLGLPSHWLAHARYAPNAEYQVWSYTAWAGDIVHAIVAVLSGRVGHGAINALWLLLGASATWSLATNLSARSRERWASVALYAAFPPLIWMAGGMQTELAATVLLLAFAVVITGDARPRLLPAAILLAGLFAWKLAHGITALPLLLYALWRHRAQPATPLQWIIAIGAFLVLSASSYAMSWHHTGNPILPAFNNVFASTFAPLDDARDTRWFAGFGPGIVWNIVFDTDRYVEGWDGGLGFTLIALAGTWLLLLLRPGLRMLTLAVSIVALLSLVPMQYARYAWPGIVLLSVLLPVGLEAKIGQRIFAIVIIAVCVLNLSYQANASWLHHSAALKRTLLSGAHATRVIEHYIPELLLMQKIPTTMDDIVLDAHPQRNVVASLAGRGRTITQHDPSLQADAKTANEDGTGKVWQTLLQRERIRWVLVNQGTATPALRAGLTHAGAMQTDMLHTAELWRVSDTHSQDGKPPAP